MLAEARGHVGMPERPRPNIYAVGPTAFRDITAGSNNGRHHQPDTSQSPGYDLATGWGVPDPRQAHRSASMIRLASFPHDLCRGRPRGRFADRLQRPTSAAAAYDMGPDLALPVQVTHVGIGRTRVLHRDHVRRRRA